MIKQFVLTIEAGDEHVIDMFIEQMNMIAKAIEGKSPIKLFIENKEG